MEDDHLPQPPTATDSWWPSRPRGAHSTRLSQDPKEIARVLNEHSVEADHVFFFSYIQPKPQPGAGLWTNTEELVQVNSELLKTFLQALKLASIKPKRFMLQTGAKVN